MAGRPDPWPPFSLEPPPAAHSQSLPRTPGIQFFGGESRSCPCMRNFVEIRLKFFWKSADGPAKHSGNRVSRGRFNLLCGKYFSLTPARSDAIFKSNKHLRGGISVPQPSVSATMVNGVANVTDWPFVLML